MSATHVDYHEVVMNHFASTGQLHPDVMGRSADQIEELIDAIPDENPGLIKELEKLLEREGVR